MKKLFLLVILLAILIVGFVFINGTTSAAKGGKFAGCTTIQDGILTYSTGHYLEGEPLTVGYDIYGYNYQAHMFNGLYCNAYLGRYGYPPYDPASEDEYVEENPTVVDVWCWPYRNTELMMTWNDAWLSNKDCDGDGQLDRHYGFDSYIGSGAWLTNHMRGDDWTYFVKIAAKPTADYQCAEEIWGSFCVLQRVSSGEGATLYETPGLGNW
jgi:hypothetical protein